MNKLAPYQIFFPIGVLSSLVAISIWPFHNMNLFDAPVMFIHSRLIVGGFIWSFIIGFLMTAIPKMSGTRAANRFEVLLALALISSQIALSWTIETKWFYLTNIILILFLMYFAISRILKAQKSIPVFFSHVGIGMLLALAGAVYHFNHNNIMGIHLYHLGSVLLLVLGIGTRFFSFLSGLPSLFEGESLKPRLIFHSLGVLTAVSLFLAGKGESFAYLVLFVISLVYLFYIWKIQRPSNRPSALKLCVRLVALSIPLGFFMAWMHPQNYLVWFHIIFIGCFTVIIYAVATRVTLAHGSYSLEIENAAGCLWWMLSFFVLSIVSRICYTFSPAHLKSMFLLLAVSFWVLAIASWCYTFFMKMLRPGKLEKPSC